MGQDGVVRRFRARSPKVLTEIIGTAPAELEDRILHNLKHEIEEGVHHMKGTRTTRRALSLFLGLVVLFSVFAIPSAFGEEGSAPITDDGVVVEEPVVEP